MNDRLNVLTSNEEFSLLQGSFKMGKPTVIMISLSSIHFFSALQRWPLPHIDNHLSPGFTAFYLLVGIGNKVEIKDMGYFGF